MRRNPWEVALFRRSRWLLTEGAPLNKATRAIILFIAQGAFAGKFPGAPGTAGTLVGVAIYLLARNSDPALYITLSILLCILGTWVSGKAEMLLDQKDSPSIVIDEIAGFLIAMFMVPAGWGFIIAGFLFFRAFDIVKPWPLFSLQKIHGGAGIMLDDIGAGIYTNIVLQIAAFFLVR